MKVSNQDVIKLCICCNTEYSCSYINRNSAKYCSTKCKREAFYKIKQHKIDDFVVCPICNNKYKEINTAHITTHNLTIDELLKTPPNTSTNTNPQKNHQQKKPRGSNDRECVDRNRGN